MEDAGIGGFIKRRRLEIGITSQAELAFQSEVRQETISRLERNLMMRSPLPEPHIVAAVARALRVTEMDLLRAAGYLTDSPAAKRLDDDGDAWTEAQDAHAAAIGADAVRRIMDEATERIIEEHFPDERGKQRTLGI